MIHKILGLTQDRQSEAKPAGDCVQSHEEGSEVQEIGETLPSAPSKMSMAQDVFRRLGRKKITTRKEIVAAFIEEVGLTKAGAATYYQIIKKGRR